MQHALFPSRRLAVLPAALLLFVATMSAQTQDTATSRYNAGMRKYRAGDLPGAIAELDRAIELNPEYWKPLTSRGVVKKDHGDLEGALRDHSRSIEINPKNAAA